MRATLESSRNTTQRRAGLFQGIGEAVVAHPTASHWRPAHEMLVPAPPRPAVFPHPTVWTSLRVTAAARPLPGLKVWRFERWRGLRNRNRGARRCGARFFQELERNQAQVFAAAAQAQTVTKHLSDRVSHRVLAADGVCTCRSAISTHWNHGSGSQDSQSACSGQAVCLRRSGAPSPRCPYRCG